MFWVALPAWLLVLIILSIIPGLAFGLDPGGSGSTDKEAAIQISREFMLSFDDGPLPGATERVLDALATLKTVGSEPVVAGFFLVSDAPEGVWQRKSYYSPYEIWASKGSIVKFPHIALRIKQRGHIIGNHTAHHAWFRWPWLNTAEALQSEFLGWEATAEAVLGEVSPRLFRPPYLVDSEAVRDTARQLGYRIVMGKTAGDTLPWTTPEQLKTRTQQILESWDKPYPCLLIFHDILPVTYQNLGEIVQYLQQLGFRLVHFDISRLPASKEVRQESWYLTSSQQ